MKRININLNLKWNVEVRDKTGKVTFSKSGQSKSLLRNFIYWLQSKFTMTAYTGYANAWTAPDTGNTSRTFPFGSVVPEGEFGYFGALTAIEASGLRVGSLDTAVTPVDFEMAALIHHGTAAGNLSYGAHTVEAVTVVGQNSSFRVSRPFTNSTGNTVTVKEIGAAMGLNDTGNALRYLCYLRDVLPASVPVPDGSTFTLRYTFTVTA